jgi:hypothetical protein
MNAKGGGTPLKERESLALFHGLIPGKSRGQVDFLWREGGREGTL